MGEAGGSQTRARRGLMEGDVVELEECFLDSPLYRERLTKCDNHLQAIEQCLRTATKSARSVIAVTNELSNQYREFAENLVELGRLEANRPTRQPNFSFNGTLELDIWTDGQHIMFLAEELKRVETARQSFALQLETIFVDPLDSLLRTDLPTTRELKKRWEKCGTEYLHVNSRFMARKAKDAGLAEGAAEIAALRREYHQVSLEYVGKIGEVLDKEQLRVSEAVLALCHSRVVLCDKERAIFEDIEPNMIYLEGLAATRRARLNTMVNERNKTVESILEKSTSLYNPLSSGSLSTTNVEINWDLSEHPMEGVIAKTNTVSDATHQVDEPNPSAAAAAAAATANATTATATTTPLTMVQKSGYLYKRSSHTVRPFWSRRFFTLHENCLEYYSQEPKNSSSTVKIDLRLCTVKRLDIPERRHCFEIVSPVKTYTLQAENAKEMEDWMEAIQSSIHEAIHNILEARSGAGKDSRPVACQELLSSYLTGGMRETALSEQARQEIMAVPGNDRCADCGMPNPEWASISLGILVCIECSGIHRSLGVHKSKVRSLRLDFWEPEHVDIMKAIGNQRARTIFEATFANKDASPTTSSPKNNNALFYHRPSAESVHIEKEQWIVAKYDLGKFIEPITVGIALRRSLEAGDLVVCLRWLACGGDPDAPLPVDTDQEGGAVDAQAALHIAFERQHWEMAALLILWSANVEAQDGRQDTVLHYMARQAGFSQSLLTFLLKRDPHLIWMRNERGEDAVDVALQHGHGDICTILRMFQHDGPRPIQPTLPSTPRGVTGGKKTFKRLLKHYPKFYRRLTNHPRRRRSSSLQGSDLGAHDMARSFEELDVNDDAGASPKDAQHSGAVSTGQSGTVSRPRGHHSLSKTTIFLGGRKSPSTIDDVHSDRGF